jgi:glucose/arabinose dehydrogenase
LTAALDQAAGELGPIEVLEYSPLPQQEFFRPVLETTVDDLAGAVEFSIYGPVTAVRQVLPGMRDLGRGSILFVNGGSGARPNPKVAGTSIAFAGESGYATMLHDTLTGEGIQVGQLIIPGAMELTGDGRTRRIGTVDGVRHAGESGLLGLALDDQDRLYAYSTGPDGNRIQRFDLTGQPGSLGLGPTETVIDGLPSASYHDGGRIAFGPDGMLYATVGDAGRRDEAQDRDSLGGKILRMTPDGDAPADNPFPGSLVYSYGHRNPQGLAWAADGRLFAAEFGQNTWDELNIITPGGNYGWPVVEGIGDDRYSSPSSNGAPTRPAPAASPSSTARSSSPTSAVRSCSPSRSLTPPRPLTTTPVSTGASAT